MPSASARSRYTSDARVAAAKGCGVTKIVYVVDKLNTAGGTQTHIAKLSAGLDRARFESHVVCLHDKANELDPVRHAGRPLAESLRAAGIPVTTLGTEKIYGPAAARAFVRFVLWLRREKPHIVHTYLSSANVFGAAAARAARVPFLFSSRRDTGFGDGRLLSLAVRLTSRWATRVVAVSEAVAQIVRENDGVKESRLTVIPNGVDLEQFRRQGRGAAVRELFRIPSTAALFVTVAHLTFVKGIDVWVKAAAAIKKSFPEAFFLVVGGGRDHAELTRQIDRSGLSKSFVLAGERTDVADILEAADVFVLPSRSEGLPNALLEAMAIGLPVVATRVGGVPEVVSHDKEGLLVDLEDRAALAEACLDLLRSPALAEKLGREAKQRIVKEFSLGPMVRRYEELYLGAARMSV